MIKPNMKHRLLAIFLLPLLVGLSRAQTLSLQVNSTKFDINNNLSLTISLDDPEDKVGGEVNIEGLNGNFDVVGQSRASNTQVINGEVTSTTQLRLELRPKKAGTYTIGPAMIPVGTGTISSNQINVEVTGERTFLNGTPQGLGQTQPTKPINDIQIKTLDDSEDPNKNIGLFVLILLGFAGLCYASYKKLMRVNMDQHIPESQPIKQTLTLTIHDLPRSDAYDFLEKADAILRTYIKSWVNEETSFLSYEEMKKLLSDYSTDLERETLLDMFEKAKYSPESIENKDIRLLMKDLCSGKFDD